MIESLALSQAGPNGKDINKVKVYSFYISELKGEETLFICCAVSSQFSIFIYEFNGGVHALGLYVLKQLNERKEFTLLQSGM